MLEAKPVVSSILVYYKIDQQNLSIETIGLIKDEQGMQKPQEFWHTENKSIYMRSKKLEYKMAYDLKAFILNLS